MIKINRRLKKEFKTGQEFESKIKGEMTADVNGNVSVDQLRDFVCCFVRFYSCFGSILIAYSFTVFAINLLKVRALLLSFQHLTFLC